jgi:hypothetical protein
VVGIDAADISSVGVDIVHTVGKLMIISLFERISGVSRLAKQGYLTAMIYDRWVLHDLTTLMI